MWLEALRMVIGMTVVFLLVWLAYLFVGEHLGGLYMPTATSPEDQGFDAWKGRVNLEIARLAGGLVADDLPDVDYYAMYDDGATPKEAARDAIRIARTM